MDVAISTGEWTEVTGIVAGSEFRAQGRPKNGMMLAQAAIKPAHDARGFTYLGDSIAIDNLAAGMTLFAKLDEEQNRQGENGYCVVEPR